MLLHITVLYRWILIAIHIHIPDTTWYLTYLLLDVLQWQQRMVPFFSCYMQVIIILMCTNPWTIKTSNVSFAYFHCDGRNQCFTRSMWWNHEACQCDLTFLGQYSGARVLVNNTYRWGTLQEYLLHIYIDITIYTWVEHLHIKCESWHVISTSVKSVEIESLILGSSWKDFLLNESLCGLWVVG